MGSATCRTAVWFAVIGATAAGCNWTTFSSDADHAPIRSVGAPGSFDSRDFGQSILPLSDGQGSAAAFVATSINDTNMVVVTIDSGGGAKSSSIPSTQLLDTNGSAITALAEIPGSAPTQLLFGTPEVKDTSSGRAYTEVIPMGSAAELAVMAGPTVDLSNESGWGRGVAVGNLAGTDAPDYAIGSDNVVAVVVDHMLTNGTVNVTGVSGCEVGYDASQDPHYTLRRPLLTVRLWADPTSATLQQLVVASTHTATPGKLSFFNVTSSGGTYNLNCLTTVVGPSPHLGQSMAAGDFDGDGNMDLLVGAPGHDAFVFLGSTTTPLGTLPMPIQISDMEGVDFGYAVAALNIDDVPGDEALIGDPGATVGGQTQAGHVLAYTLDKTTTPFTMKRLPMEFADHAPESGAKFGSTVSALPFCTAAKTTAGVPCPAASASKILMVGASNEVFVHFRVGVKVRDGAPVADVRL